MKEAAYYTPLEGNKVRCRLCPHHCLLTEGKRGICLTRQNVGGKLISQNYCRPISTAIDPIEKKPLFHFYPGSQIFSTGPNGCNFKCGFCQNFDISQQIHQVREIPARKLVDMVVASDTIGIAYTYAEPMIWYETIMEVGSMLREQGLVNVLVTNGYVEQRPLLDLLTLTDAMNIDIKSMNPDFYRRICKADLGPVLRTCETAKKYCHVEITNLLITDENDTLEQVGQLAEYIAVNLGADTPLHLSRYFPRYHFTRRATPERFLMAAWEKARERLEYVYVGNLPSEDKENTHCPNCNTLLIRRSGYMIHVEEEVISAPGGGKMCSKCGKRLKLII
jgi:pyruvate formate lyase activating enzyme